MKVISRRSGLLVVIFSTLVFAILYGRDSKFEVNVDGRDSVSYEWWGGERGADWSSVTLRGNGKMVYRYVNPLEPQRSLDIDKELSPSDTRYWLQSLVDEGIFGLSDEGLQGGCTPGAHVRADMDGYAVDATYLGTRPRVHDHFISLSKIADPGRWGIAISFIGTVQSIDHSREGWAVNVSVEEMLSGSYTQETVGFGGHRLPHEDFEIGKRYRIKAVLGRHGYSVRELEEL